jgi:hypothetical protein
MSSVAFVILLFSFFLVAMFWKTASSYLLGVMKICHNHGDGCCRKVVASGFPGTGGSVGGAVGEKNKAESRANEAVCKDGKCVSYGCVSHENSVSVVDRMGYYLASNDEEDMSCYRPTPLQDVDPQDLA